MSGQAAFRAALLDPVLAVPPGLLDPEGRPAGKRFDVYRNNVVASLCAALEEGFPVVARLLGPQNFRALAGQYVRAHPPGSPVLSGFGAALPGFLADFAPLRRLGYLPDVARLELALRDSYHAADAAPLPPEALQALPPERLAAARLRLAPAVRLVVSDWPIVAIWRFNREDGPKPAMAAEGALVSRPGYDPVIASLTPAGAAFVAALAAEKPLGAALEAAAARDAAFDPAPTLGALISGGALVSLEEPAP